MDGDRFDDNTDRVRSQYNGKSYNSMRKLYTEPFNDTKLFLGLVLLYYRL